MHAASDNNFILTEHLLKNGALKNISNEKGTTGMDLCKKSGLIKLYDFIDKYPLVDKPDTSFFEYIGYLSVVYDSAKFNKIFENALKQLDIEVCIDTTLLLSVYSHFTFLGFLVAADNENFVDVNKKIALIKKRGNEISYFNEKLNSSYRGEAANLDIAKLFDLINQKDSAYKYFKLAFQKIDFFNNESKFDICLSLADYYTSFKNDSDSMFYFINQAYNYCSESFEFDIINTLKLSYNHEIRDAFSICNYVFDTRGKPYKVLTSVLFSKMMSYILRKQIFGNNFLEIAELK